jgi:Inner membrane component of T3SS, cytoplasmic domain
VQNNTVPDLAIFGIRIGLLALLWVFVLAAVRVMRNDMTNTGATRSYARPPSGTPKPTSRKPHKPPKAPKGKAVPRKLLVTAGGLTGTSMNLSDEIITIGRADDSTLVLTDDYASARHARLVPHDGQWLIEDLGSTNGTYLDRDKVTGPTIVPPGAAIRIGKTAIELRR